MFYKVTHCCFVFRSYSCASVTMIYSWGEGRWTLLKCSRWRLRLKRRRPERRSARSPLHWTNKWDRLDTLHTQSAVVMIWSWWIVFNVVSRWSVRSWHGKNRWGRKRNVQKRRWNEDFSSYKTRRDFPTRHWWEVYPGHGIIVSYFRLLYKLAWAVRVCW